MDIEHTGASSVPIGVHGKSGQGGYGVVQTDREGEVFTHDSECNVATSIDESPKKRKKTVRTKADNKLLQTYFPHSEHMSVTQQPCVQEDNYDVCINWMKKQSKLRPACRDVHGVLLRMTKTYQLRRDDIMKESCDISIMKQKYPLLFTQTEMLAEFKRITKVELLEMFNDSLDKYAPKLIKLIQVTANAGGEEPRLMSELRAEIQQEGSALQKSYANKCLALLSLPYHLGDSLGELVKDKISVKTITPYIVIHKENGQILHTSNIEVFADTVLVCKTDNIIVAFCLLVSIFYIFHIAYPKMSNATLTFLQKYFVNIEDGVETVPKVVTLLIAMLAKC